MHCNRNYSVGERLFVSISSWINLNKEYEYFLLDDSEALDFICSFGNNKLSLAYQLLYSGAAKADLWRHAILYRYGGVYVDIESYLRSSFRSFVWPNASVVSSMGLAKDLNQWCLIYIARHPFSRASMKLITHKILNMHSKGIKTFSVPLTTGPGAFYDAVMSELELANCVDWIKDDIELDKVMNMSKYADSLPNHYCPNSNIGVLQIFSEDYLGGQVEMKIIGVDDERLKDVSNDYRVVKQQLLDSVNVRQIDSVFHIIGNCSI